MIVIGRSCTVNKFQLISQKYHFNAILIKDFRKKFLEQLSIKMVLLQRNSACKMVDKISISPSFEQTF